MTVVLAKYGFHGFPVLTRMLAEDRRELVYEDYTATMQKIIAEAYLTAHGASPEIPSYIEMVHVKEKQPTAEEVKKHIIERLGD